MFQLLFIITFFGFPTYQSEPVLTDTTSPDILFLTLLLTEDAATSEAFKEIEAHWEIGYVPMALEVLRFSQDASLRLALVQVMQDKTGQSYAMDIEAWYEWLWNQDYTPRTEYADFKASLYRMVDPRFEDYFASSRTATIRLDEVMWGGVKQDGIPPLRNPDMITVAEATYLDASNVVFGIEINGEARAYPKRILAWHEMFVDTIQGEAVAGVYCTLCGTVILYYTEHQGIQHELGTSGFLYRSNKLMYDKNTQSLWNTMWGEPVIGPLADEPFQLKRGYVVTTTWGEWTKRHPETLVLSLDTGHERDYREGAAYRSYFATDELMFNVPRLDRRLKNKAEVLTILLSDHPDAPVAISARFLDKKKNRIYHDAIEETAFVVLTDGSGANRVYQSDGYLFIEWDGDTTIVDERGITWELSESRLVSEDGITLDRLPAQRAFWFGWYAAFPETRLIK